MARIANSLAKLRDQVNAKAPNRNKASDGWIGDAAHAASASDHNPNAAGVVCALDITHDPANGMDVHALADRLRVNRHPDLKYIISNSRICGAWTNWGWVAYAGSNPHNKHAHFSVGRGYDGQSTAPYDDQNDWAIDGGGTPNKKSDGEIANEVKAGKWGNGQDRINALTAAGYNYNAIQNIVNGLVGAPAPAGKSNEQIADEVRKGYWGNGQDRVNALQKAGYDYNAVQAIVNATVSVSPAPARKSVGQLADEVLAGYWGNGDERVAKIQGAGYDYRAVQNEVNARLAPARKSNDQVANEVLAGSWGNGADRVNRLRAAGYDADAVQRIVNSKV